MIAARRRPGERGIGDTIEANLKGWGVHDPLKWFFRAFFGGRCGCVGRKRAMNQRFPYPQENSSDE